MNKFLTTITLAALLVSTAAYAQDANVNTGVSAGATVETPSVDANAGAGAAAGATANTDAMSGNTMGSVMSSISGSANVDLSAVTDEASVTIVLLSSLEGTAEADTEAFDAALSADAEGQTTLHSNLEANAAIKAKLEAEGYATSDVVAVTSNADGSVTVFVDDRA